MLLALTCFTVLLLLFRAVRLHPWVSAIVAAGVTIGVAPYLDGLQVSSGAAWGIGIGAALLTAPWHLGPLLIRSTQRMPSDAPFERYNPLVHQSPETIRTALAEAVASLTAAGFTQLGEEAFRPTVMAQSAIHVVLMENAATGQKAMAAGMFQKAELVSTISTHVEIGIELTDGRQILVNNAGVGNVFAKVAGKTVENLQSVRDAARLAEIHRRLVERVRGETPTAPRHIPDVLAFLGDAMRREMEQQIPLGYLWLDGAEKAYRPTWKGAALMCWKLLPPWRTIRAAQARRREAQLLAELGMQAPDAQPAGVPAVTVSPVQHRLNWAGVAAVGIVAAYIAALDTRRAGALEPAVPPAVVPAEFEVPNDFPGAVRALEQLTGTRAEPLMVRDSMGTRVKSNGARVAVRESLADSLLMTAQRRFLERGFFLFRHEPHYDLNGQPDELALVPLWDQYRVVKLVGTNGANHGLSNADVISWLRALEQDAPFVLIGIGFDHVEGRFTQPLADPHGMAQRLYRFCPDVVDQGTGSVSELATELRRLNTFFCWWD